VLKEDLLKKLSVDWDIPLLCWVLIGSSLLLKGIDFWLLSSSLHIFFSIGKELYASSLSVVGVDTYSSLIY
jgi:hypothetical protein